MNETWQLSKSAVTTNRGLVVSQHHVASAIGAEILDQGGTAIDAAIATSAAIGVVEPWMSGLGGVMVGVYYERAKNQAYAVQAPARAPYALNPADYPLSGGVDQDLFGWPSVEGGRNVYGYTAIGMPGVVAGWQILHERFGRLPWREVLHGACEQARQGLIVDWFSTLKIAAAAKLLTQDEVSRNWFLPEGFVPAGSWAGPPPALHNPRLTGTLDYLRETGPGAFYQGDLADCLVRDLQAGGAALTARDFADYRASLVTAAATDYRGHRVFYAPELNGGPSIAYALQQLATQPFPGDWAGQYRRYAEGLQAMWRQRLTQMGHEGGQESCTTHLAVVDRFGNVVSLTQTLLSVFGSKVTLPSTGILMNNGIMWFDPRPGRPNSLTAGATPLANMGPVVLARGDGECFAVGGSGGRRILPAVVQLVSFLADDHLTIEAALNRPRLDVSGGPTIAVDDRLEVGIGVVLEGLGLGRVVRVHDGVYPNLFACPNLAVAHVDGRQSGIAFRNSPVAGVAVGRG